MSRFSRDELKEVIKECVVEVLQESFGALQLVKEVQVKSNTNSFKPVRTPRRQQRTKQTNKIYEDQYSQQNSRSINESQARPSYLDNISYNSQENSSATNRNTNPGFDNKINNLAQNMTSDPVLSDIFKDTARTTLQEQISAEGRRGAMPVNKNDPAALKVSQSDPTDLFGAAAGKWAQLAFAPSIKNP